MNFVMAYPAKEEFALSSLGYMWLAKTAQEIAGVSVIRISADNCDINPAEIDAIAFSMSFDFDFAGVFEIFEKLKIPFYKKDRGDGYPLIFAGGPVITTNPKPYEAFFDFMMIGDGESGIKEVLEVLAQNKARQEKLKELKRVEGIYLGEKTKKRTDSLSDVIYSPVVSEKSYFKNTFIIEVSRGCMNRCAFCTASYINFPFRNNQYEKITKAIDLGLTKTNKIALLGAQISAHPRFADILKYIREKIESGVNIELGISSLRTDSVTPEVVETLVMGGQRHSTIAIEAASERLRSVINKNLKEEQILDAVKIARENGLKGLKIYSMIGIPTETEEDILEFLNLAKKIKAGNKGFSVEFSFSTFVPKPHTPFQWAMREDTKSLEKKQKFLEKELSKIGFSAKFSSVKWDYWQTVLSRSGEELSPVLVEVYKRGGKAGAYKTVIKELGVDITKSVEGFDTEELLPWDCIEMNPGKDFLAKEYRSLVS